MINEEIAPQVDETPVQGTPVISVITVVYNGIREIEQTIRSVISQAGILVEYIVVDGGSKDGTVDIIEKYKEKITNRISEPDKGIYDAMNKGIDLATGDWIIFMNAGDRFASPDTLYHFTTKINEADIIYGDAVVEYPSFTTLFPKVPLDHMWKQMPFCHQAAFVRTPVMKSYKFDLRYKLSSDFNFLYKAYLAQLKFQYIDHVICYFDFRSGASKKNAVLSFSERKQIVLSHNASLGRTLYYAWGEMYLHVSSFFKQIVGSKLSEWITKSLKK